jgi:hypothetical protein
MGQRRLAGGILLIAAFALAGLAQSVAASDQEDEAKAAARRSAMLAAGRAGFCRVHVYFKRAEDEVEPDYNDWRSYMEESSQEYEGYIAHQMSLVATGLLLDGEGHVLVLDSHLEDRYIDHVEVVAPDGRKYPAVRDRLLERAPAEVLKITEPLQGWKPPAFVDQEVLGPPGKSYVVSLQEDGHRWWLSASIPAGRYDYLGGASEPEQLDVSGAGGGFGWGDYSTFLRMMGGMGSADISAGPGLLCNEEGQPIGAAFPGWPIEPAQEHMDWQYGRLVAGPALSFGELDALSKQFEEGAGSGIHKCRILYRQEGDEDSPVSQMMMRIGSGFSGMGDEDAKERTDYGLAVTARRLLIPQPIGREEAARIESIEVTVGDQKLAAHFAGAFKDVGAFLVDLDDGELPSVVPLENVSGQERMRLFFTAAAREKFGRKDVRFRPNRWFRRRLDREPRPAHCRPLRQPAHRAGRAARPDQQPLWLLHVRYERRQRTRLLGR